VLDTILACCILLAVVQLYCCFPVDEETKKMIVKYHGNGKKYINNNARVLLQIISKVRFCFELQTLFGIWHR